MIDVLIIAVIFGYAAWTLYRFFTKSKKGACSSCSQNKSCSMSSCHTPPTITMEHVDSTRTPVQEHK
ncbi:hypothetical protein BVG16_16785 [Paenibacillus selenitireducens]|uniref:FeoB-associated Cys-rich membrane protein n=1 Tax=Paenibacillus selenitireducens TaxID=1324314 RepID=A0A1T2XAF3_9BACL|nr:FeoB-associated Cys-rich membrane protein [Paenibacillus selenitireducens]OPA76815.1 hypothetical protein BVG16_16785 [Paenibacillus selenitireducens]